MPYLYADGCIGYHRGGASCGTGLPDGWQERLTQAFAAIVTPGPYMPSETERHITWLREHNAGVRFESNGTVSVWANGIRRRRKTFRVAMAALIFAMSRRSQGEASSPSQPSDQKPKA